jgi:hypothetical protein
MAPTFAAIAEHVVPTLAIAHRPLPFIDVSGFKQGQGVKLRALRPQPSQVTFRYDRPQST